MELSKGRQKNIGRNNDYKFPIFGEIYLVVQMVKNLPAMQQTKVRSLGCKDPLEKGMAIHSSSLAWRIQWTEESGRLQSMWSQRVRYH